MSNVHSFRWVVLAAGLAGGLFVAGCGSQGAPQPPSLNLPDRVADLSATRTGNQVSLTWTMPKKNTDKLLLKGSIAVHICRKQGAGVCEPATAGMQRAPGADGTFSEMLPAALTSGQPRPLSYFVELENRNGRSAGLSNAAVVLAGVAPPPIEGLRAEVRKSGVVLHWTPVAGAQEPVRLHRKLLTPPPAKVKQDLLSPPPEPIEQNLLVESDTAAGRALDREIRFGQTYEYRVQRVARIHSEGGTLELAGELSVPVRVEALNTFPPAVPSGLAAVATPAENGNEASIDLSWQPDTEADLTGYIVYRREGDGAWQRISPPQPVVGPAFHDPHVQAGHTYHYAVTAIDQNEHESARSVEAQETVPNP